MRQSYIYNENWYACETASLYWDDPKKSMCIIISILAVKWFVELNLYEEPRIAHVYGRLCFFYCADMFKRIS